MMNRVEKLLRRKPVNLTADVELVEAAKSMGLNLSQLFEESLRKAVWEQRKRQWEEENREALDQYNRFVEDNGVFSDGLRSF
jgi:antitoxin CcdA